LNLRRTFKKTVYGSIIYDFPSDFVQSAEYLMHEECNVEPIISEIIPFKEYTRAYEKAVSGRYEKIIFNFKEDHQ
jgi:L-iditol 2-dehydrogenase